MNVQVTGQINDFRRVITGLASVDALLADHVGRLGWPGSTVAEIYGPPLIGKSTISVYLAARVSAMTGGTILPIVDLETAYDRDFMALNAEHAGFEGTLEMISIPKEKSAHEKALDRGISYLQEKEVSALVIDSIGALIPQSEMDNPLGASNMGKRGQLMAQVSRKLLYRLRIAERPKFVFLVNHQYQALGTIGQRVTPGGNAKSYAAGLRITMYRTKDSLDTGDMVVALRCDKKRIGGVQKNNRGYVYMIPDYGVSPEMTAVFDCLYAGYAEKTRGGFIKMLDQNYGRVREMRTRVVEGDLAWAAPFIETLQEHGFNSSVEEVDDDDQNSE